MLTFDDNFAVALEFSLPINYAYTYRWPTQLTNQNNLNAIN